MKIFTAITCAALLCSTVAVASDDKSATTNIIAYNVKPHETRAVAVYLPKGNQTVEVSSSYIYSSLRGKISCVFRWAGKTVYTASHTDRCLGVVKLDLPANITASITNEDTGADVDVLVSVFPTAK